MAATWYPIKFDILIEEKEWAGEQIEKTNFDFATGQAGDIGIYWQLVDQGDLQSQVINGPMAGSTLRQLVNDFPRELVGQKHPPDRPFPLCCRILDVGKEQPLRVHPPGQAGGYSGSPDTNAKFWHVLAADEKARVTAGIAQRVTGQQLISSINKPALRDLTRAFTARGGDSFLIPPGIIHAVGAGTLVWELKQHTNDGFSLNSGTTGEQVTKEEQEKALNSILLESRHNPRISREASGFTHTRRIPLTPHCPYFLVDEIRLFDHIILRTRGDTFHLLFVRQGHVDVFFKGTSTRVESGELCCIPATLGEYKILQVDEPAEILRVQQAPFT
ncbi:MAG: hypothetical protein ACOCZS_03105 [Verrucomicrobiota bacterium]